jgi:hypothetical protein
MRVVVLVALLAVGCSSAYYEPCGTGGICPQGLLCADPGRIDVCTTLCTTTDECMREHGAASFCSLGGVCLTRCTTDTDCPVTSYCETSTTTCVR